MAILALMVWSLRGRRSTWPATEVTHSGKQPFISSVRSELIAKSTNSLSGLPEGANSAICLYSGVLDRQLGVCAGTEPCTVSRPDSNLAQGRGVEGGKVIGLECQVSGFCRIK